MSRRLLLPLVVALIAAPAAAYVLPARALLALLEERRVTHSASTQRVEGSLLLVDEGGVRRILPAEHLVRFPGRCALRVLGDEPALVVWDRGKVTVPAGDGLSELAALEALACPVLAVQSGAARELSRFMGTLGVQTGYTGLSRMDGRPAYVIGAHPWESELPQLWLDQERYLPVRVVGRAGAILADVRLTGYGDPVTGEWHPRQMELWIGGKLRARFVAEHLEQNVTLEEGLFR